jgi:hypothetical protein
MFKLIALVSFLLSTHSLARADFSRHSCMTAGNIKALETDGACRGFVAHDAKGREVNRVDKGYDISGSISASPDGRSVVMIQSYPESDQALDQRPAIVFFRDGKQIATYTMVDVIGRMELITASISHYSWIAEQPADRVLGKTLRLTTTSQRNLEFDVATGKLVSAQDTKFWSKCDQVVYAGQNISKQATNGVYTLARAWLVKGKLLGDNGSKLTFAADAGVDVAGRSGVAVCLVPDKKLGWRAVDTLTITWNQVR